MYGMVLMAALTTGTDMPDMGRRRGGGCCGCCGGMAWGGGGRGGCYGGYARGGCGGYGMGMGYGGMGMGYGGMGRGMSWGGWGGGYGSYAYSPMMANYGTPVLASNTTTLNPTTQSFFYNPANRVNEATLIVHLPADANLTIGGEPTRSTSNTRVFFSPPLQPGKTYTYTLRAEINRDGQIQNAKKTIEVQAGRSSNVTLSFNDTQRDNGNAQRDNETNAPPPSDDRIEPTTQRRTPPPGNNNPTRGSLPTPPRDR